MDEIENGYDVLPGLDGFLRSKGMTFWIYSISGTHLRITLSCLLSLVLPLQLVHAEVNIQQSSTSNINGQEISVQTVNEKTVIKTGDKTLTIKGDTLQYCAQACHEYVLNTDGTISEKQ